VGAVPDAGKETPGVLPVAGFTRFNAVAAPRPMPLLLVAVDPICPPLPMNGASAHAVATVVASSMTTPAPLLAAEQVPSTDASAIALFDEPTPVAEPPRATTYTTELL
jgi:hypothetical protein